MRKITAIAAALIAAFTLAAPAQAAPLYTQKDRTFVYIVRHEAPWFRYTPARLMINLAHKTCEVLDSGEANDLEIVQMMIDSDYTEHQSLAFVSASVTVYCPWHAR